MIPKPIHEIRLADLQGLVGVARESKMLEFKLKMPGKAESESVPFLAGVSSLANTAGGDFVLGVVARDGLAEDVPGIAIANLDAEKLRLEQLLANGLEPRLPCIDIESVECSVGCYALVVRVPHSWVGPHRVKANNHFYGRNSGGRYPLDVSELRTAFVLADSVAERVRAFRAERLARIGADETPVPLPPGGRAILHVIPFPSFADRRDIDVVQSISTGTITPLPLDGIGANQPAVNLDGFVNYVTDGRSHALSYVQLFRNGAIEGVKVLGPDEQNGRPYIPGPALTIKVVFALRQYLEVLRFFDMGLPVFAFLSFTGMDGCTLRYSSVHGGGYFSVAGPRRGAMIMLPEITIESPTVNVPLALKPVFNALWNAFGFLRCDMYDGQGAWTGDR